MLPKVLCLFALAALVAAAPYTDRQYIDELQKEYEEERYDDMTATEDYGQQEDTQQQFHGQDEQKLDIKDFEQFDPDGIEQTDDEKEDIEQTDDDQEDIEQTDDEKEDIEQVEQSTGDDMQDIEQVEEDTGYQPSKIEVEQQDDDWNQHDDSNNDVGDETVHFEEEPDELESDSAIGKLFGETTAQEQEGKYGDYQDQQQSEVGHEFNYSQEQPLIPPVQEVVPPPKYNSNYGSGHSGAYQPSDPFEPEAYTPQQPWLKRVWTKTKDKARSWGHKIKETFGKK